MNNSIISYNHGKSITFWPLFEDYQDLPIVIGKDAGDTFYLQQEDRNICINPIHMKEFIKALQKFYKENKEK